MTLKVMPRPRNSMTLVIAGLSDAAAFAAIAKAMRSQAMVAAAAYVPSETAGSKSQTLLRLEGFAPSVEARCRLLNALFKNDWQVQPVDAQSASALWSQIRCVTALESANSDAALWRICVPTTATDVVVDGIRAAQGKFIVDWAGGLIWARVSSAVDAKKIRELAELAAGHATLVRAPLAYREHACALHPEPAGVAALSKRVRAAFDPNLILDPHRFAERMS
jgi:glycolate oxidase FAD binding subunit